MVCVNKLVYRLSIKLFWLCKLIGLSAVYEVILVYVN